MSLLASTKLLSAPLRSLLFQGASYTLKRSISGAQCSNKILTAFSNPLAVTTSGSSRRTMSTLQLQPQLPPHFTFQSALTDALQDFVWFIKRTFQPSIIRKKRKTGFLVRQRTVGGRRTLNRRKAKGRARLGGGI